MEIDYNIYKLTKKEIIISIFKYTGILIGISILFYDNIFMCIITSPLMYIFIREEIERKKLKRLNQLNLEYKEMIMIVSGFLNAGYSLENAFINAKSDIRLVYPEGSYIEDELGMIINGLENNIPIEKSMRDFADRSGLEEIYNFAEVLQLAKRNGGNLIKIISNSGQKISEKIEVYQEIETVIASKKLEQKIMGIMPFLIILYIRISNGSYINILYETPIGFLVMTLCLIFTFITNEWAKKIVNIEV